MGFVRRNFQHQCVGQHGYTHSETLDYNCTSFSPSEGRKPREVTEKNRTTEDEINFHIQEICKSKNMPVEKGTNRAVENEENLIPSESEHLKEKKLDDKPICISCRVVVPRIEDFSEIRTILNSPAQNEDVENMDVLSPTRTVNDVGKFFYDNFNDRTSKIISARMVAPTVNIDENAVDFVYVKEWPSENVEHEFHIQVSLISTLPVITYESNEKDVLSLINVNCRECRKTSPLFFVNEWAQFGDDYVPLCSRCKANGKEERLEHFMTVDLLVQDGNGKTASAIVAGAYAEQFFGCTMVQLITSNETQLRVRNFIAQSKTLILKLKRWKSTNRSTRYMVLAKR